MNEKALPLQNNSPTMTCTTASSRMTICNTSAVIRMPSSVHGT